MVPGLEMLVEEMGCVLKSSVVVSVGTLERRVIFSVVEMFCWMVLVSLSSGLREDVESVSIVVVSVEWGIAVETAVSLEVETEMNGDVTSDGSESAGVEE